MSALLDAGRLLLGHWTDEGGRTGCTVVLAGPEGMAAAIDVRGGAPATTNTELLQPAHLVDRIHAIVLSGGSEFGLVTADGVRRFLAERDYGFRFGAARVPIVCGAVIFDLGISSKPPGAEAGYAACLAAGTFMDERGSIGAGAGATVGKALGRQGAMRGGLGTASRRVGAHVVGGLVVVNAFGDVVDREDRIVAGARRPDGGLADTMAYLSGGGKIRRSVSLNTTLGIVATNARLGREDLTRVAQMAQDGLGRAIRPAHTMVDGDLVFAVSVGGQTEDSADPSSIGAIGAEVMVDAILDAVLSATGIEGIPAARELGRAAES